MRVFLAAIVCAVSSLSFAAVNMSLPSHPKSSHSVATSAGSFSLVNNSPLSSSSNLLLRASATLVGSNPTEALSIYSDLPSWTLANFRFIG